MNPDRKCYKHTTKVATFKKRVKETHYIIWGKIQLKITSDNSDVPVESMLLALK